MEVSARGGKEFDVRKGKNRLTCCRIIKIEYSTQRHFCSPRKQKELLPWESPSERQTEDSVRPSKLDSAGRLPSKSLILQRVTINPGLFDTDQYIQYDGVAPQPRSEAADLPE